MIRFVVAFSLLTFFGISQDLNSMHNNQEKRLIATNTHEKKEEDTFYEDACLLVGGIVCGGLGFSTALSSESYLEGAELPFQAAANLFEQSTACALIGVGLGKIVHSSFASCKKIKQE